MFRSLALAALLLATPGVALASGQVFLAWDDCADAGQRDMVNGCLRNDGAIPLVCAFSVDQPVSGVLGIEVTVDLQVADPALSDWWQMGPGQCRDNALTVSGNFAGLDACADAWNDLGEGQALYYTGPPRTAAQARMIGSYAIVPSDSARTFDPGVRYYGLIILVGNVRSVFPGNCVGCRVPGCLVLNTVRLLRGTLGDVTLDTPGPGAANRATWQTDGTADCVTVPVRAVTWGQIKSLYR